ncbi:MAG: phosphoheptose isomerase, partial [Actinomycetota bacterium]|nr:phosphoheptose isomerase [Actinomycetota bacterium]
IDARLAAWGEAKFANRLWDRDPTLWFDPPRDEIKNRLGWLCPGSADGIAAVDEFVAAATEEGLTDVVLLGMGGSSLAPEVFASVLRDPDGPTLTVLDSTHPDVVARVADSVDPAATLFIVASKSGTTLETMSFFRILWDRASAVLDDPGSRFIAITDPGSQLAQLGDERGFRSVFLAPADVGGRFSALIEFGLIPAALVGVDLSRLLRGADAAAFACGPDVPVGENPALRLGASLGEFALAGRDKIVFDPEPIFVSLPVWIEQLIAESLGKDGKGILPVADGSAPVAPDRLPFTIGLSGAPTMDVPSVTMTLDDAYDLGGAMYILEMATAAAGAILGVHPFDQPDVQLAKSLAHTAMTVGLDGFDVTEWTLDDDTTEDNLRSLFSFAAPGGYVAIQAYLDPTGATAQRLGAIADVIADATGAAVTIGYGPRFLHSTGQFHKGGSDGGVFLQIVDHPSQDLDVPETDYSLGKLITAQSFGDRAALRDRGRPIGMVCLGDAGSSDLPRLKEILAQAVESRK